MSHFLAPPNRGFKASPFTPHYASGNLQLLNANGRGETDIVRMSFTGTLEGCRILHKIGEIEAASAWHPENRAPLQQDWQQFILRDLVRKAEDIDADAIIEVDCQNDGAVRNDETGVKLRRVVATGIAVKLSCAA
ncbi:MAG: hypothetical protein WA624_08395 [Methylocella sp.]